MKKPTIDELYSAYAGKVYAVCMSYLKNPQDAEDITQDTFVAAIRKLHSLKNPQKAQAWLCKIAANKCKNYLKKSKPELVADESELDGSDVGNIGYAVSPESAVIDESMRQSVRNIVDDLPDAQKAVICGFYFDCKSIKELSRQLNCKQNTVKSILHRSRKSIREECDKRGVTLNGISVGAALSSCAKAAPTAAKGVAGALAARIAAGVLAAAVAAYGIIGVCIYSGRDNYSDYCDVYDGSRKISAEPLKISDVRLIGDPVDRTNDYEAVPIEEVSEKLKGFIPIVFIDNDRLYGEFPKFKENTVEYSEIKQYIYNFATDTLTPVKYDGVNLNKWPRITSRPTEIQYKSPDDYWLIFEWHSNTDTPEQLQISDNEKLSHALHFTNDKADRIVDLRKYFTYNDKAYEHASVNAYARKLARYERRYFIENENKTITIFDFDGGSKEINLPHYIEDIAWLNDEWIEAVCVNNIYPNDCDFKQLRKYIVKINVNTEQIIVTEHDESDKLETPDIINDGTVGFYPQYLEYYGGYWVHSSYVYDSVGDNIAIINESTRTFDRYCFKNNESIRAQRGKYIYTEIDRYYDDGSNYSSIARYDFISSTYELLNVSPKDKKDINWYNQTEQYCSPNGKRILFAGISSNGGYYLEQERIYMLCPKSE